MKWLCENDIVAFLSKNNYDIRRSHNARWIDQKCAADVITVVADCILNFSDGHSSSVFSSVDIWHHEYTVRNVENIFKKPNPDERKARSEYDKFFQQPMEMLAYAGVLDKRKIVNRNIYRIKNKEILIFLSIRERNSLLFLSHYIQKVMRDSGLWPLFENFFFSQSRDSYDRLKRGFSSFTINNTPIKGVVECNRIFIKVLNPIAYILDKCGTEVGRMSKHKITYDMLMYNRDNFRDLYSDKPKGMTRKEYAAKAGITVNITYTNYISQKAKKILRIFNDTFRDGKPELHDPRHADDKATHMHHIFPDADYPEICGYVENLIALTPTQHLNYAHPMGNTKEIDDQYQHVLLLSKADRINENLTNSAVEKIYDFSNFLYVLNVGFDNDDVLDIVDMDFNSVINAINAHYAT